MQRFIPSILLALLVSGCGTSPMVTETTREVVLQYLGGDVGTAGPFLQGGKKELDGLSPADRRQAEQLIDQGAALFLVFAANPAPDSNGGTPKRVVLVQGAKIVGDFHGTVPAAPAAAK